MDLYSYTFVSFMELIKQTRRTYSRRVLHAECIKEAASGLNKLIHQRLCFSDINHRYSAVVAK